MSNAGFSDQSSELNAPPVDDIPEALRDAAPVVEPKPKPQRNLWLWGILGLAIALLTSGLLRLSGSPAADVALVMTANLQPAMVQAMGVSPTSLLGHLPYKEPPLDRLEAITADGRIKLQRPAAEQFTAMAAAARAAGVGLIPLSGFRSVADQEQVFFSLKAERGQAPSERAEVSAPPGYSEHHTGYALDIADAFQADTDLEPTFDQTAAFRWLEKNAARFNFEMSFPKNNTQGVSYEPWHWRFVGDRASLETFYQARFLLPGPTKEGQP